MKALGITRVWQKWRFSALQPHFRLIKHWFYASIPIAIGMVKIATFAKPKSVMGKLKRTNNKLKLEKNFKPLNLFKHV
jgi:hypothetical protein